MKLTAILLYVDNSNASCLVISSWYPIDVIAFNFGYVLILNIESLFIYLTYYCISFIHYQFFTLSVGLLLFVLSVEVSDKLSPLSVSLTRLSIEFDEIFFYFLFLLIFWLIFFHGVISYIG